MDWIFFCLSLLVKTNKERQKKLLKYKSLFPKRKFKLRNPFQLGTWEFNFLLRNRIFPFFILGTRPNVAKGTKVVIRIDPSKTPESLSANKDDWDACVHRQSGLMTILRIRYGSTEIFFFKFLRTF